MRGTILAQHFGPLGYQVPTRKIPGWLLETVSLWDKTAKLTVQEFGKRQDVSSAKAKELLGWTAHSLEEMVTAMGESMIEHDLVPKLSRAKT